MIRTMHAADAAEAAALIRNAFGSIPVPLDPAPSALCISEAEVLATLAQGGGAMWADETRAAGCVLWRAEEGGVYLGRLAVLPAWQGRGIARALVGHVEAAARHLGAPRIRLEVRLPLIGNRRLFAACGFVEGERRAHPGYGAPTFVEAVKAV